MQNVMETLRMIGRLQSLYPTTLAKPSEINKVERMYPTIPTNKGQRAKFRRIPPDLSHPFRSIFSDSPEGSIFSLLIKTDIARAIPVIRTQRLAAKGRRPGPRSPFSPRPSFSEGASIAAAKEQKIP